MTSATQRFHNSTVSCFYSGRPASAIFDAETIKVFLLIIPVSRFECVSGLSVYPVEIRSVNNLSSSEDCSTDYCQPV